MLIIVSYTKINLK